MRADAIYFAECAARNDITELWFVASPSLSARGQPCFITLSEPDVSRVMKLGCSKATTKGWHQPGFRDAWTYSQIRRG